MECLGPQGVSMLLDWLKDRLAEYEAPGANRVDSGSSPVQGMLFRSAPYQEDAPAIRSIAELEGALEHLEYAVHRRFHNQLTARNEHGSITRSTTPSSRWVATWIASIPTNAP